MQDYQRSQDFLGLRDKTRGDYIGHIKKIYIGHIKKIKVKFGDIRLRRWRIAEPIRDAKAMARALRDT